MCIRSKLYIHCIRSAGYVGHIVYIEHTGYLGWLLRPDRVCSLNRVFYERMFVCLFLSITNPRTYRITFHMKELLSCFLVTSVSRSASWNYTGTLLIADHIQSLNGPGDRRGRESLLIVESSASLQCSGFGQFWGLRQCPSVTTTRPQNKSRSFGFAGAGQLLMP